MGRVVNRLRTSLGLTVDDVSEMAGLSAGLISQLENGRGNPSLATLSSLASALGLTVADLLSRSAPEAAELVLANERAILPEYEGGQGVFRELLTPSLDYPMQVIRTVMPPGASNESMPFRHVGTETAHLLSGSLQVVVGDVTFTLAEGDTVTYDCTRPHWWANPGTEDAVILGVTVSATA